MIHGQKKVKKQRSEQELKEEAEFSDKINKKLGEFFAIDRSKVIPGMAGKYLEFTAILMELCSDIPTIFNFRRQLIDSVISQQPPQEIAQTLGKELKLSSKLIKSDPKCYTLWSYRQWLVLGLNKFGGDVVKAEKELVKMLLMKDEKNFHAWNYRNWLNSVRLDIDQEINFTKEKTKGNPFNFSPYHFRSKFISQKYENLLKAAFDQELVIYGMPKQVFNEELQTVKTAIFLNPSQEAPWLYYNWLLSQLVPGFVIKKQAVEGGWAVTTNMKVSSLKPMIEGQEVALEEQQGNTASEWRVNSTQPIKIHSNLDKCYDIKLQKSGRLFMGEEVDWKLINETIKGVFREQSTFVDEVIDSESMDDKICRFGCLQQATICKLIMQCGTTAKQFEEVTKKGLRYTEEIAKEAKANKYTQKQLQYWQRLSKGELTPQEQLLRTFCKAE